MEIDWKAKLTSRKFWMAIIGFVTGVLLAFKVDAQTVETIAGVIMSGASVIAYIIGEGLADAAGAANDAGTIYLTDEQLAAAFGNETEPPQDDAHGEAAE